jgi:hypothetical protein
MTLIRIASKKYPNNRTYRVERPQPPVLPKEGFIDHVKGKLHLV